MTKLTKDEADLLDAHRRKVLDTQARERALDDLRAAMPDAFALGQVYEHLETGSRETVMGFEPIRHSVPDRLNPVLGDERRACKWGSDYGRSAVPADMLPDWRFVSGPR